MPGPEPPQAPQTLGDYLRLKAAESEVDPNMALTILDMESSGRHTDALGRVTVGEPTRFGRAQGFFQLLPSTAAAYKKNPADPFENLEAGVLNIREAMDRDPSPEAVFRYYFGGPDPRHHGPETDQYVAEGMRRLRERLIAQQSAAAPPAARPPKPPPPKTPSPAAGPPPTWGEWLTSGAVAAGQRVADLGIGAAKGVGQTAVELGGLVHQVPGVTRAVDALYGTPGLSSRAFTEADRVLTPANRTQQIGKTGEQVAEYLLPNRLITTGGTKLATKIGPKIATTLAPVVGTRAARYAGKLAPRVATEALAGGVQAGAHGENPLTGAVVGGAVPVTAATVGKPVANYLQKTATKKVSQVLGATKERFKVISERIVPQVLDRRLAGSREQLVNQAAAQLDEVGPQIDAALARRGAKKIGVAPIVRVLEQAKDAFRNRVPNPATGGHDIVEFEPRAIAQISGLQDVLVRHGKSATVNQLVAIRRAWDKVVSQAGGFAQRAPSAIGVPLADTSEAWAKREATAAIRQHLAKRVPNLAKLNQEYGFWKDLKDVLGQTLKRTEPQGPGLGTNVATGAARVAGAVLMPGDAGLTGRIMGGAAAGYVVRRLREIVTSPRYQLFSARQRARLADAIVNEDTSELLRLAGQAGIKLSDDGYTPPRPQGPPPRPPTRAQAPPPRPPTRSARPPAPPPEISLTISAKDEPAPRR